MTTKPPMMPERYPVERLPQKVDIVQKNMVQFQRWNFARGNFLWSMKRRMGVKAPTRKPYGRGRYRATAKRRLGPYILLAYT